jgi:hypothetical protein
MAAIRLRPAMQPLYYRCATGEHRTHIHHADPGQLGQSLGDVLDGATD